MTLDSRSFEHAIVRHCSPTLAGIKLACLFNVPGTFAANVHEEPAAQLAAWKQAAHLNARLDELVAATAHTLAPLGIRIRILARRSCGALVYVYRTKQLIAALNETRVLRLLRTEGYMPEHPQSATLEAILEQLGQRLCAHQTQAGCFPHEIGFFLGYPFADVMGFIEHKGHDYLACGCWKVYDQPEQAQKTFEAYKNATRVCEALFAHGMSAADIVSHLSEQLEVAA